MPGGRPASARRSAPREVRPRTGRDGRRRVRNGGGRCQAKQLRQRGKTTHAYSTQEDTGGHRRLVHRKCGGHGARGVARKREQRHRRDDLDQRRRQHGDPGRRSRPVLHQERPRRRRTDLHAGQHDPGRGARPGPRSGGARGACQRASLRQHRRCRAQLRRLPGWCCIPIAIANFSPAAPLAAYGISGGQANQAAVDAGLAPVVALADVATRGSSGLPRSRWRARTRARPRP